MNKLILTLLCCMTVITASAQIGYQVSLLNIATGEPRANESVNVTVKITDSAGNVVCEETKRETTNDFGVLSMTVGSQDTFTNADWSKLPFFIEATVDNRLIGRSQILSVPVAEYAKHTGTLTKEILCSKTWECIRFRSKSTVTFHNDGTGRYKYGYLDESNHWSIEDDIVGKYIIDGNVIVFINTSEYLGGGDYFHYIPNENILIGASSGDIFK